jgi:hypothetical protein
MRDPRVCVPVRRRPQPARSLFIFISSCALGALSDNNSEGRLLVPSVLQEER